MYGGFGLEKCSQIQQTIQVGELVELQDNLVCAGILLVIGGVGGRRGLCRGSDNAAKVDFFEHCIHSHVYLSSWKGKLQTYRIHHNTIRKDILRG